MTLPAECADSSHRGTYYADWINKTWCACGAVVRNGRRLPDRFRCCVCGTKFHSLDEPDAHEAEHGGVS